MRQRVDKTYKRELAGALVVWLAYLTETKDVEVLTVLAPPIFMFVAFAFGADVYTKLQQASKPTFRRGSQHSGQHTSGSNEQPDHRYDKYNKSEAG